MEGDNNMNSEEQRKWWQDISALMDKGKGIFEPEPGLGKTGLFTAPEILFQDWGIVRNGAVLKIINTKEYGIDCADYDKQMVNNRQLVSTKREIVNRGDIIYMSTSPDPPFDQLDHVYLVLGNQWLVHWDHRGSAIKSTVILDHIWKVMM